MNNKNVKQEQEVLKMRLDKKEEFFKEFAEEIGKFKEKIHRYDMEHKDEIIMQQGIEQGIEIGIEQGNVKVQEQKKEFIKSMYNEDIPLEQIARIVKVSVEEVKKYSNE